MVKELATKYEPGEVEPAITSRWTREDAFRAIPDERDDRYVIMMPLPNVTGALHMGHAMDNVMQDLLSRWHRMQGDNTLWMAGTRPCRHRHPGGRREATLRAGGQNPP